MALIVSGGLAPTISGKIGNSVWARNRGGAYIRNFAKPTNPATALQGAVRAVFASLVAQWQTLTANVKADFAAAAAQVNNPNRVGLTSNPPPLALFQQINVGRVAAGLPVVVLAPPTPLTFDWGVDACSIIESPGSAGDIVITTTDTTGWQSDDAGALLVYVSAAVSPSVNFFKGPFQFFGKIQGNHTTPPTSPGTLTRSDGGIFTKDMKYFWRAYPTLNNGQLGAVATGSFVAMT